ncbi:long-chain-fatty-acid--CoA ligase [Calderihabitans maritimus]|uniref:Long-chain-fatty-acid--CoA ligase n=1 Tax=Calderihabitans maritimus TaxID=1246530 RepID=A0A1Z5HUY7_9FIRM|nr:long-chain fatty acid--CoA ligase [Calderihabitans maritimus]GAW93343.1 long-chain-fatty-acid--CoA ligase [Calderihabitans maritimus]
MGRHYPWEASYPAPLRYHLDYPNIPLYEFADRGAVDFPERPALIFYGQRISYGEFGKLTTRLANALKNLGVRQGDRVAVMGPNCPQWVIAFFGTLKAGGIVVQTNPMSVERELENLLNNAGVETIFVYEPLYLRIKAVAGTTPLKRVIVFNFRPVSSPPEEGVLVFDELLRQGSETVPGIPVDPKEDLAVLQYTGGTTGIPKGVMLTHFNLVANVQQTAEFLKPAVEDPGLECMLTALPLFHVYGMTVAMNVAFALSCPQVLLPKFEVEEVLETIKSYRITLFPGAPTMYVAIINYPEVRKYNLSSIKACISGSAPLPVQVQRQFEELTGGMLVEGYGLSEASPVTHCNPIIGKRKYGSIGLPFPDTEVKIMDVETGTKELSPGQEGELVIKGPQVMKGYWNNPEETAVVLREGWLYTGDIAKMDEEGYFYIVDRKKDLIIASGFNIYPREVEEVLYEHTAVQEAAVIGVPDVYRGETVKAFIVLKEGASATEDEIIQFCRSRLAAYKVPRLVEFRTSLPKTAAGKILRRLIREEEYRKLKEGQSNGLRN